MAKQTVNLGTMADNKSGDPLRTAFEKINENFDEVYEMAVDTADSIPRDISQLTDIEGLLDQVGATTITKTAVNSDGAATEVSVTNSPNTNWTNGTGVFANGINFAVAVTNGVATVSINDGGTGHFVGETFGPVLGSAFGGTDVVDDMYFQVDAVQAAVTPALDLTKTINKLTPVTSGGGSQYTLADGAEGQIMYIVPATGGEMNNQFTTMAFDHARWSNGNGVINEGTDVTWWLPFQNPVGGSSAVLTLIFTDGHWNLPHNWFD